MSTPSLPRQHDSIPVAWIGRGADLRPRVAARAHALLEYARAAHPGWSPPPFDPLVMADALGIPVQYGEIPPDIDAMMVPDTECGFRIVCRARSRSTRRARFSIAHELAHTFFDDAAGALRMRSRSRHEGLAPEVIELERLCDAGAAELLMPAEFFRDEASALGAGASSIPALSERFEVSLEAAALRFVETTDVVAAGFFEFGTRPSGREASRAGGSSRREPADGAEPPEIPTYRVRRVFNARGASLLFPLGKSVPQSSVIYQASLADAELSAVESFVLGRTEETLRVRAVAVPADEWTEGPPLVCAVFSRT